MKYITADEEIALEAMTEIFCGWISNFWENGKDIRKKRIDQL